MLLNSLDKHYKKDLRIFKYWYLLSDINIVQKIKGTRFWCRIARKNIRNVPVEVEKEKEVPYRSELENQAKADLASFSKKLLKIVKRTTDEHPT